MRKQVTLITGAAGEVGSSLINLLGQSSETPLLTLDLRKPDLPLPDGTVHINGDILDETLLSRLVSEYEIVRIYHLAALLSTRAEFTPETAHRVNVEGTRTLLKLAAEQSQWLGRSVQFIFPSSMAVYGLPTPEAKARYNRVREWEWTYPTTMYGCNKLYCEMLGSYHSRHYKQLASDQPVMVDFRSVRFPGLISAYTLPTGGTSDYAPEMLHAAARGEDYDCFVDDDVRIPFMAMPDATNALIRLAKAPRENLTRVVYNVTSFSLSASEIRHIVVRSFPKASIKFKPDKKRQAIVDSWPADLDDSMARRDWEWEPSYNKDACFCDYLIPNIKKRYQS